MDSARRSTIRDLYNTDLERYFFAPAPRASARGQRRWTLKPTAKRLSRWFGDGWQALSSFASVLSLL